MGQGFLTYSTYNGLSRVFGISVISSILNIFLNFNLAKCKVKEIYKINFPFPEHFLGQFETFLCLGTCKK